MESVAASGHRLVLRRAARDPARRQGRPAASGRRHARCDARHRGAALPVPRGDRDEGEQPGRFGFRRAPVAGQLGRLREEARARRPHVRRRHDRAALERKQRVRSADRGRRRFARRRRNDLRVLRRKGRRRDRVLRQRLVSQGSGSRGLRRIHSRLAARRGNRRPSRARHPRERERRRADLSAHRQDFDRRGERRRDR